MPGDPFVLEASLAAKIGSLVAHVDEAMSLEGHPIDQLAVKGLLANPDVQDWLAELRKLNLLPVPR